MAGEHDVMFESDTNVTNVEDKVEDNASDGIESAEVEEKKESGNLLGKLFRKGKKQADAEPEALVSEDDESDVVVAAVDPGKGSGKRRKAKAKRKDERLSSVLTESEPGAAVDVMRQVEPFTIPGGIVPEGAWLTLVLPTADKDFGGLNKRQSRDEDKGLIINFIQADEIQAVITPDLLEDDALAIIPSAETLERMDEFTILREARYFWGVAVVDPDTAAVMVLTIPPKREEDDDGRLFNSAAAVSRGDMDITDVIDISIVKAMWDVFSEDGESYGANGALASIDLAMDAYAEAKAEGRHITGVEIVSKLRDAFPKIDPDYDPDADFYEEQADDVVEDASDTDVAPAVNNEGSGLNYAEAEPPGMDLFNDETPEEEESHDDLEDQVVGETPDENAEGGEEEPQSTEPESGDVDEQEPVEGVSISPGSNSQNEQSDGLQSAELLEQLTAMMPAGLSDDDVNKIIVGLSQAGVVGYPQQPAQPMSQSPSQIQGEDSLHEKIRRSLIDDDLGLEVETTPFDQVFYGPVPKLTFNPYDAHTPWLNEQLDELVRQLNANLEVEYTNARELLRERYLDMANKAVADIALSVDPENEGSRYNSMKRAAEADKKFLLDSSDEKSTLEKQELRQSYEARRKKYVEARMGELSLEFDRNNKADLDYALGQVEPRRVMTVERVYDTSLAQINQKRRDEAQMRYQVVNGQIVEALRPELESLLDHEVKAMNQAVETIKEYVATKSSEDLVQAQAINDRLERDNRVEEVRSDAQQQIEIIQQQADEKVADIKERMQTLRDEQDAFIADLERDNSQRVAAADRRAEDAHQDRDAAVKRADKQIEQIKLDAQLQIEQAQEVAEQARSNADAFMDSQRQDNTTLVIAMIVIAAVMLGAGTLLGMYLL